ncbi:MAG: 23S rRNA (guanosine(2251)-2'-O)-methyltransferase RlmB [Candidatus Rokuibacteriota bacterium]
MSEPPEVVYGRHPVIGLLKGGGRSADEVAVLAGATGPLAEIVALARRASVKISFRTRDQLTAIAGSPRHQGVVARVASAPYADLDTLLAIPADRSEPAFFLALDQIQDPRNLGALLRTADAFGVHGIIIAKHHQVGLTSAAARTAMGALGTVPVARETNLVMVLETLKKTGVWVYGCTVGRGVSPWEADLTGPVCIVLGSEGEGLRPLVARTCDGLLTIPMAGRVGSLNVSAAGAVLCYEVARQRRARVPRSP